MGCVCFWLTAMDIDVRLVHALILTNMINIQMI